MSENKVEEKKNYQKLLLQSYLEQKKDLSTEQKKFLSILLERYLHKNQVLLDLYFLLEGKDEKAVKLGKDISLSCMDSVCMLQYQGETVSFDMNLLKPILAQLVDLTEDILPLGSLVQLKKEYCTKLCANTKTDSPRIIITNRFLKHTEQSYYTYGGVVYPVGSFNRQEILQFTPALIDKVLQKGYRDEQEDTFVYLMKKELILENGQKSAGFILEEENR